MLRSVVGKAMWLGRTASAVFGLALVLALVFGVAAVALGATGGNFLLGKVNTAGATSKLTSSVAGATLQLLNNGTGTALNLVVPSGKAPMTVNSSKKVANLNADELDGKDSTRLVEARADIDGSSSAGFRGILEHSEGAPHRGSTATVVAHAPEGPPVDVSLSCPPEGQTGPGTLQIKNNTPDFGDSQRVWVDDGSANPSFDNLGQNQSITKSVSPSGDHFTIQVKSVFNTNRMATMELFTESFGPSICGAEGHVTYTFAP
jgi:hypothetical protein